MHLHYMFLAMAVFSIVVTAEGDKPKCHRKKKCHRRSVAALANSTMGAATTTMSASAKPTAASTTSIKPSATPSSKPAASSQVNDLMGSSAPAPKVVAPPAAQAQAPAKTTKATAQTSYLSTGDSFADSCLHTHNSLRATENSPNLVWDDEIAKFATNWARQMANMARLEHSTGSKYGENLYATFGGDKACSSAVNSWYSEKPLYQMGTPIGSGNFADYGHFTQVCFETVVYSC